MALVFEQFLSEAIGEHVSLLVSKVSEDSPFAVLSGGALLVGSAGRTDLLGPDRADELTQRQLETLRGIFLKLPDGVLVYPTHVHGSPCGVAIGDKPATSIAQEKACNALLQEPDAAAFKKMALDGLSPKPSYYPWLKRRTPTVRRKPRIRRLQPCRQRGLRMR